MPRLAASEEKATCAPSLDRSGYPAERSLFAPSLPTDARVTESSSRSLTYTSDTPSVSSAIRFPADVSNATRDPSPDSDGRPLGDSALMPPALTEASRIDPSH